MNWTPSALLALVLATALATYLLRAVPLVLLRRPLENRFFVTLLEVTPYALLAAMIFPNAFYATDAATAFPGMPPWSGVAGVLVALGLSLKTGNLPLVAAAATAAAWLVCHFGG